MSAFVIQYCKYDSERDLAPVDPFGYINLREAYENHSVPTNIADDVANYNQIDNPESILGTPSDIFEAYRMHDSITKYDKEHGSKLTSKTPPSDAA